MSAHTETVQKYRPGDEDTTTPSPNEVVSLLGDEYTRTVIETLGEKALSAQEIDEQTDMSRPTIYRRINDLKDSGMVETKTRLDGDGHHKEVFMLTIDEVTVSITELAS
jgi:DNA-binding HxlR family transcriptional regulator